MIRYIYINTFIKLVSNYMIDLQPLAPRYTKLLMKTNISNSYLENCLYE